MQIGAAIGSLVGRYLRVTVRERRILLIAGVAGGMSAVFRTPLGAALLAVEVLYRDDFESDALIPALLASVVSYSVFISFLGESTLFAHAPRYPFVPAHLPLYAVLALSWRSSAVVSFALHWRPEKSGLRSGSRLGAPRIGRPRARGLRHPRHRVGRSPTSASGAGAGHLRRRLRRGAGGHHGGRLAPLGLARRRALADGCPGEGRRHVAHGRQRGQRGDFGPSLVMGGLFGGAFGRAAALLLHDPRIDPGAFALVGMGTFYGGIAHVPISSLVMVCELAGSYDLLVPLMLAEGIAFVALRKRSLYRRNCRPSASLRRTGTISFITRSRPSKPGTSPSEIARISRSNWQHRPIRSFNK